MLLGSSLFLMAALGLGLLLSTLARTQQQAFALNFFLVNPLFILSGFAFPIAAMPRALQWFTLINPLRYFLVVIRAEFLKGVGVGALWTICRRWRCWRRGCSESAFGDFANRWIEEWKGADRTDYPSRSLAACSATVLIASGMASSLWSGIR